MPMDKDQLKKDVEARKAQRPQSQAQQASQPAGELMTMDAMQQQITNASVKQIRELAHFGNQLSVKMHDAYARLGENIVGSAIDAGFVGIGEGVQRALAARNMDTIAPTSDPLSAFDDLDLTINTPKLPSGVSVQKMLGAG